MIAITQHLFIFMVTFDSGFLWYWFTLVGYL